MIARLGAAYIVFFFLTGTALVAQSSLRIDIDSSWSGLGSQPDTHMTITGRDGRFISNGRNLDPAIVRELLAAMDDPSVEHPSLAVCGVDRGWREANYARGLEDYTHRKLRNLSSQQIELFRAQFVGDRTSENSFEELFKYWHTDDFPKLSVRVTEGDREYGVSSTSQYPLMLPWFGIDRVRGGYSCRLSRAIFALVPKGFTNRGRLVAGESFRWQLTAQIMNRIRPDWNSLDAQHLVGPDIAPILARFHAIKSEVSNIGSIDLNGGQSWNAELTSQELPLNLHVGVSLLYTGKSLAGVDTFLNRVSLYTGLVLSMPWLHTYMKKEPGTTFELRYVNGRSLSPKAAKSLADDLRLHGKLALAENVEREATNSAFLEINAGGGCWSRALVVPDRELLLWHFKCDSVLGFSATQFTTWDYYGWRSADILIDSDGRIMK